MTFERNVLNYKGVGLRVKGGYTYNIYLLCVSIDTCSYLISVVFYGNQRATAQTTE